MSATIQTVLGPVPEDSLGVTMTHEHLYLAPVTFRQDTRVVLNEPDIICQELKEYKELGGVSMVEVTPIELGRDPQILQDISRKTQLHIVMGTAFYTDVSYPDYVRQATAEEIGDLFLRELTAGVAETGIRAGVIGEVGTSGGEIRPDEVKVFQGAVLAHNETGAPIFTHTYWGQLGLEQVALLQKAGADMSRVVIGHLDSKLDLDYHQAIADSGAYVAYDCVGKSHFDPEFGQGFPPDAERASHIIAMVEAGYGSQIVLSSDICKTNYLRCNGGFGFGHLLREFVPMLRECGMDEETLHTILVENPRRILAY